MTITDASTPAAGEFVLRTVRPKPVADAITITWRNLLNIRRNPQLLVFATIQPIVFVLMFRYVFGGSITVPGYKHYVDYLMPGIFVQTVVFGALTTGVGLADDLQKGLVERFRSLPMARSAVLVGRTLADLVRNIFVVLLMAAMGFLVGWHVATNVLALFAALALVVAFAYSLSWVFAIVGMSAPKRGDRTGRVVPDPRATRVRVVGVRQRRQDARPAARVREAPAGLRRRQRGS